MIDLNRKIINFLIIKKIVQWKKVSASEKHVAHLNAVQTNVLSLCTPFLR